MDDIFDEPLGDLSSLPDIHADNVLDWDKSDVSSENGTCRKKDEFEDQSLGGVSSPSLPPLPYPSAGKTTEEWLIDQVEPIIKANESSPNKPLLFPRTFNGLVAAHALAARLSKLNASAAGAFINSNGENLEQGIKKTSKKNQSRCGMTYSTKCEQCGEKKKKCKCAKVIDASVVTFINNVSSACIPSESFERKLEFCINVSKRGVTSRSPLLVTSKNWIDREIEEENSNIFKESSVEVSIRERGGCEKEIEREIKKESLWTKSITIVKYEEDEKSQNGMNKKKKST